MRGLWVVLALMAALVSSCVSCTRYVERQVFVSQIDTVYIDQSHLWGQLPNEVVIPVVLVDSIAAMWQANEDRDGPEFALCIDAEPLTWNVLTGKKVWHVIGFVEAEMEGQQRRSIETVTCPPSYEGRLHSHPVMLAETGIYAGRPINVCMRSETDLFSFWEEGPAFEIVWCGFKDWRWYTRNGEQGGFGKGKVPWGSPFEGR